MTEISGNKKLIKLTMWNHAEIDSTRIPLLVREYKGRLKFVPEKLTFEHDNSTVIESAKKLVEALSTLR